MSSFFIHFLLSLPPALSHSYSFCTSSPSRLVSSLPLLPSPSLLFTPSPFHHPLLRSPLLLLLSPLLLLLSPLLLPLLLSFLLASLFIFSPWLFLGDVCIGMSLDWAGVAPWSPFNLWGKELLRSLQSVPCTTPAIPSVVKCHRLLVLNVFSGSSEAEKWRM